jgi:hypothetical protein
MGIREFTARARLLLLGFAISVFALVGCAGPNAETHDEFPSKWVVVQDGDKFVVFRLKNGVSSEDFPQYETSWSSIIETNWRPFPELEKFAKEHLTSKGTFVYLFRVDNKVTESHDAFSQLGKLGVICLGPRESLAEQVHAGARAQWVLDNLPSRNQEP